MRATDMATRKNNPTTKKYNRLYHSLANLRAGRCPVHNCKMVKHGGEPTTGGRIPVKCPECPASGMKDAYGQVTLWPEHEHVFSDVQQGRQERARRLRKQEAEKDAADKYLEKLCADK